MLRKIPEMVEFTYTTTHHYSSDVLDSLLQFKNTHSYTQNELKSAFNSIPKLPFLEQIMNLFAKIVQENKIDLDKVILAFTQHALGTTASLIQGFINIGLPAANIFGLYKHYSASHAGIKKLHALGIYLQPITHEIDAEFFATAYENDVKSLWSKILENIHGVEHLIILDDGGSLISNLPSYKLPASIKVAAVEQTTFGIRQPRLKFFTYPYIPVATSALKKVLESPIIAKSITSAIDKVFPNLHSKRTDCGVIGKGVIGHAVANKLLELGHNVYVYDTNDLAFITMPGVYRESSVLNIIAKSEHVFGCSGFDIFADLDVRDVLDSIERDISFISCSSKEIEFLTLKRAVLKHGDIKLLPTSLSDIFFKTKRGYIAKICRSGFPINFHQDLEDPYMTIEESQMIRVMLACGVLHALLIARPVHDDGITRNRLEVIMLNPKLQQWYAKKYIHYLPQYTDLATKFADLQFVIKNSGGNYCRNSVDAKLEKVIDSI
jgi:hypothetical protein